MFFSFLSLTEKEAACCGLFSISALLLGRELVLPDAADLAGEIGGKIFPLHALLFLVVNPAANIAYVSHAVISFPVIRPRALSGAAS
jgi:hypothetical protein